MRPVPRGAVNHIKTTIRAYAKVRGTTKAYSPFFMPSSWHKTGLPSRQRYVLRQMEVFFSMIQTAMCSNAGGQQPRVTPHTLQHDREVIDCRTIDYGNRTGSAGRHLPLCGEGKLSLAVFRRSPQGDTFEQYKKQFNNSGYIGGYFRKSKRPNHQGFRRFLVVPVVGLEP